MARGRFISNAIMSDKKINELSDDTSRLAFTWLITTADSEGRTHGDPAMVRSILFPRRTDITTEQIEAYITEWARAGLITWYEANGDKWIMFPNFDKHQIGIRKDHEAPSFIPQFVDGVTTELLRSNDGVATELLPHKLSISKGKGKSRVNKGVSADKTPRTPPQIAAYRDAAHRYPNKSLHDLICATVGPDEKSCTFYRDVVTAWIAIGWNPSNVQGQLDFYKRGELPAKNGNGAKPARKQSGELTPEKIAEYKAAGWEVG